MNTSHYLHPNTPAPGLELVVLVGLPASGKSTFVRTRLAESHVCLRDHRDVAAALLDGQSVVIDSDHPTAASRRDWIDLGQDHGARVVGMYFAATATRCAARNKLRPEALRVSDSKIFSTQKQLERPSLDEGFHELWLVKALFDEMFLVSAWENADMQLAM